MEMEDMVDQEIGGFMGCREFGKVTKCTAFDKWSTIGSITMLPCERQAL